MRRRRNAPSAIGCMRLYRGAPPECAAESIYGVTSLEFG
jgi:hypothetical protein